MVVSSIFMNSWPARFHVVVATRLQCRNTEAYTRHQIGRTRPYKAYREVWMYGSLLDL